MHDFHFFGGGWMMIFWWILILAVVALVIWALKKNNYRKSTQETPMDTLKRRYASGEIDKEEFEERKKILKQ
jgi:putative membrane protein